MKDILLIRKFLNKEFTEGEKEELNCRAASDYQFKKLIEEEYHLSTAIKRVKRREGLNRLRSLEQSIRNEKNHYKIKTFSFKKKANILAIAASIAVIIAFSVLVYFLSTPSIDEVYTIQLYETKFEPGWRFRGVDGNENVSYQEIFRENYDEEDYVEAVKAYQNIPDHLRSQADSIAFGYSLLKIGQSEGAISVFTRINNYPNVYSERLEWYIALCLINTKQYVPAEKLLNGIINNPEHDFQKNAMEIMRTLP